VFEPIEGPGGAGRHFNGAPGQQHWVIRQHPHSGERYLDRLWADPGPNHASFPEARAHQCQGGAGICADASLSLRES